MSEADSRNVLVAMSGGVDSSVAAAALLRDGWEVRGAFMQMLPPEGELCAASADDALRVADTLGIECDVLDVSARFAEVVEYFVAQYAAGRTPNPCIRCNALLKFGLLHEHARGLKLGRIATGHYARTVDTPAGRRIVRAADRRKDQSYALFCVKPAVVADMLLPLGDLSGKDDTRRLAREWNLPVHAKPESQEICFVPDDDYARLLAGAAPQALRPGEIVDEAGEVLGTHEGYGRYTIGQRRGLGVAGGVPLYVTRIDPAANRVVLGTREQVASTSLRAGDAIWHAGTPRRFDATVQIRYNHRGAEASVTRTEEGFEAEFAEPQHAVTPGQAAVVYDGDLLLGGGWIR
jgi:tRNA-uridine 2-sulfurtransferase